jgi:hypothetical protein
MPGDRYEFRVEGHLPSGWSDWFEGLSIQREAGGVSVLSGPLPDQAALHGVLARIRDLNLNLISVTRVRATAQTETEQSPDKGMGCMLSGSG